MRYAGVFNRDGGTFRTMDMDVFCAEAERVLAEYGHTLDCRLVEGKALLGELERANARNDIDAVLAGGGDGTISAAAAAAFRSKVPLAVLPAGTMNLFARSIGLPLGLPEALLAIASGNVQGVDIASANGRPFVHQYSVGIHTRLVRMREEMTYRSRMGKIVASFRAAVRTVSHPPNFEAEIRSGRGLERRQCSAVIVSNNPLAEGHLPHADALDAGVLGVYIAKPMSTPALMQLGVNVMLGRWKASPLVAEREVTEVTLTFPHRKSSALATIDGELVPLERRVELKVHPGALQVVAPAAAKEAAA